MRKNLLLTTALVALVATNANAAAPEVYENQTFDRKVNIYSSDDVTFNNVVFNKLDGGVAGAILNNGTMTVNNSNFTNNTAYKGGAIASFTYLGSNPEGIIANVNDSTFRENSVTEYGGAYFIGSDAYGKFDFANTKFINNTAGEAGGALFAFLPSSSDKDETKTITISDSHFEGNSAKEMGAIGSFAHSYNGKGGLFIKNTNFLNNKATDAEYEGAGAIFLGAEAVAKIEGSTFDGNTSASRGGAISMRDNNIANQSNAVLDIVASTFKNNTAATNGGAIYNTMFNSKANAGSASILNTTFENNTAGDAGGAIFNDATGTNNGMAKIAVNGGTFKNNEARVGGAINNSNLAKLSIENSLFEGNKAVVTGGAINNSNTNVNEPGEIEKILNTKFVNNEALANSAGNRSAGGAVRNQGKIGIISGVEFNGNIAGNGAALWNGTAASIVEGIENTKFINNKATGGIGQGGAITNAGIITNISKSIFEGNSADKIGGAVANVKPQGNVDTKISFNDVTFRNNTAGENGGAIYNDKAIELTGNTVFEGNKANGKLNDLHNLGNIEVSGNLTLDGGITGENGTINFAEGTNLTVKQGVTTIAGNTLTQVANATLNLVIANGGASSESYKLVDDSALDGNFKLAQNNLYNIVESETQKGTYEIAKKSANEVAQSTGASANQAQAIDAVTQGTSSNGTFNNIANSINDNLQSSNKADVQAALTALDTMGADEAPIVQQVQVENTAQIISAVSSRLSSGAIASAKQGAASGDSWLEKGAMWVQSLFNKSKLDDHGSVKGFDADTNGIAFGFEKKINNDVKVGVAYAYNNTDVDGFMRDTEIDAHSAILYSEYKPAEWFVNTVISYTWGEYDEDKYVLGNTLSADYDVNSIAWQAMTGYEFAWNNTVVTPQAGLRYIHYEQDSYKDSADTYVSGDNADLLTAVVGAKISTDYQLDNGMMLVPEARLAMTYDLNTDSANASVRLANGGAYSVKGDRLDRVAVEFGAGVKAEVNDNVELAVAYEGSYRDNYEDHTGLLNLKYNF